MLKSLTRLSTYTTRKPFTRSSSLFHHHHQQPLSLSTTLNNSSSSRRIRSLMTISHPSQYVLNAPSPYIVHPSFPSASQSNSTSTSLFDQQSTDDQPLLLDGYEKVQGGKDGKPSYAIFKPIIEQSPNDDKIYRLIMLENGLEALIISDPKADKASAAMDVKVGHLSDPEDLQGLAHFCEHLMFMGTKKFPKENDYTEFLTQNSGSSNAFTGMDQTCYFFDVEPQALEPALDRFSQFFIEPLFDPSCSEREANAVHSENSKNLQNDMWRLFQLDKSTSSKDNHVYWRFGTGNKSTLWDEPIKNGIDVRERLIDWCEKHYSSNISKLVVLSKDSLDKTTQLVVDQFSKVKNRNLSPPNFKGSPLTEKELGRTLFVKSVRDTRSLEFTFPFPDESKWYSTKPGGFLSHLIGHEGKGSILSLLKEKGWANGMSAGAGNGANGFEFFKINVDLTRQGLENYEEIAEIVFGYIKLLSEKPPSESSFREVSQLSKLGFRFKESSSPSNTTSMLSMSMSKPYPREKLLSAPWLCTEWHPTQVEELVQLLKPENCRLFVVSQKEVGGRNYTEKEKWYGTEYCIEKTSDKILNSFSNGKVFADLALPEPNQFVPEDLEIKGNKLKVETPAKRPLNLKNSSISRVWYKKDDRWWVPRASGFFLFRSPEIDSSALNSVSSRLFTELVRDSLNEYSYDADLAGLSYSFEQQGDGILLNADGYNDKLEVLLKVVVTRMKELKLMKKEPYNHVSLDASHLTQATSYTVEQKLKALDQITPSSLENHISKIFKKLHIESLLHGNLLKDEALNLSNSIESILSPSSSLSPSELKSHQALVVPLGKTLFSRKGGNSENPNCAVEQFTYVGNIMNQDLRCKLTVLGQLVSEPLFDVLRAKEQLGYIVSSGPRKSIGFMGLRVIVQSEKSPTYVEKRIDNFWKEFEGTLEKMKEEEFVKYRESVRLKKLEDHKNLWQESSHLWLNIHSGWYDFEQRWKDAEYIKSISKESILEFFKTYFLESESKEIRRLSVHLESPRLTLEEFSGLLPMFEELELGESKPDSTQLSQFVSSRPTFEQLIGFAENLLKSSGKTLEEIELVKQEISKRLETGKEKLESSVQVIKEEEMDEWRNKQERAPHAKPVKEYADLFPAKM